MEPTAHGVEPPGRQCGTTQERGRLAQLLLDAQELVVLGHPVRAGRRAGLDLTAVGGHGQVGDGGVLGLPRPVGHHAGIGVPGGQVHGLEGLGERPDLVDLDQHGVGGAGIDPPAQALLVGDEEVVADQLDRAPSAEVSAAQPSQSSSAIPSSIDTIGYRLTRST